MHASREKYLKVDLNKKAKKKNVITDLFQIHDMIVLTG